MKKFFTINYTSACLFAIASLQTLAQPGYLDPTFGNGGKVITSVVNGDDFGISVAIQSDNKLVVTGYSYNGSNYDVAVIRYNSDGTPDSSFGVAGIVTTPIGTNNDFGLSVAIQPDAKIVVGGYSNNGLNNDFAVVRYNSNGTLDNTFGTGGIVTTPLGNYGDVGYALALQADGKILLAGYSDDAGSNFFGLIRYKTNGSPDSTFGTNGIVTTPIGPGDDQGRCIAIQADGKILVGGYSYNGNDWDFALVRYNTSGTPDNGFGTSGIITTPMGSDDNVLAGLAIQADGKIVGAGFDFVNSTTEFAVARYNTDGQLDNSFGNGGWTSTPVGIDDDATSVVIQADGKIVVAGTGSNGTDDDFAMVRYLSDGTPDSTFGLAGKVLTPMGTGNDIGLTLLLQSDGKLVLSGFSQGNGRDFSTARYDGNPVGFAEMLTQIKLIVKPNPFNQNLFVTGTRRDGEIHINDMLGEEVIHLKASDVETYIETAKFAPGIYMLNYFEENQNTTVKLVKF